jgi:hypothetical protein
MLRTVFWPTAAQVMPVLALAIIIEARATISRWSDSTPTWLRLIQGILWAVPLILYAYLEPLAFQVMAGRTSPNSDTSAVIIGISTGVGVLVGAPTIGLLVGSSAKIIASAYTAVRFSKFRIIRTRNIFRCKRILRLNRSNHDRYTEQLVRLTSASLEASLNYGRLTREGLAVPEAVITALARLPSSGVNCYRAWKK